MFRICLAIRSHFFLHLRLPALNPPQAEPKVKDELTPEYLGIQFMIFVSFASFCSNFLGMGVLLQIA